MTTCDVVLVVGTSSLVTPASLFAPMASLRGAIVAEFNIAKTPATPDFSYYFEGPSGKTLPIALA